MINIMTCSCVYVRTDLYMKLHTELGRLIYYIIVMLMYYVMTTMWRALNQRGLRRVYAQSLI